MPCAAPIISSPSQSSTTCSSMELSSTYPEPQQQAAPASPRVQVRALLSLGLLSIRSVGASDTPAMLADGIPQSGGQSSPHLRFPSSHSSPSSTSLTPLPQGPVIQISWIAAQYIPGGQTRPLEQIATSGMSKQPIDIRRNASGTMIANCFHCMQQLLRKKGERTFQASRQGLQPKTRAASIRDALWPSRSLTD